MLMSDTALRRYMETGSVDDAIRASQDTHARALQEWGGEENLAHAHAEFGTEYEDVVPKTVMSFTTDPEVAKYFANGGPVYRAMISPSDGIRQTLPGAGESEVLIPHAIKVEEWTDRL